MNLLSFFNGIVIDEKDSTLNGKIQVIEFLGQKRIVVNGLIQSGGVIRDIWKKALKSHQPSAISHQLILILGLGGGTAARLVSQKWPEAKITGVEIDPIMVNLGKKYFDLDKIPNLKIIRGDAINWVESKAYCHSEDSDLIGGHRNLQRLPHSPNIISGSFAMTKRDMFDLILVDLYKGEEMAEKTSDQKFLKGLKRIIRQDGVIIFNCLFYGQHRKKTKKFIKKLENTFPKIFLRRSLSNLMISVKI